MLSSPLGVYKPLAEPNSEEVQRIPRDGRLANRVGSSLPPPFGG